MKHSPLDSLRYFVASDTIGVALDLMGGDAEDVALDMLTMLRDELRYEARLHGVEGTARYSTGILVFADGQCTSAEPRPDGTTELVINPTVWCPYPSDGGEAHPICRSDEGAFA